MGRLAARAAELSSLNGNALLVARSGLLIFFMRSAASRFSLCLIALQLMHGRRSAFAKGKCAKKCREYEPRPYA
jgi:hypothetical protein